MAEAAQPTVRQAIMELAVERGAGKTICPSEAARAVAPGEWRELMHLVRGEAELLAQSGRIVIMQAGQVVDPTKFKGAYRLGLPEGETDYGQSA